MESQRPSLGLTAFVRQHTLPFDILQAWEAGKAVRIGHGPATVIGATPKVRTPSHAVAAGALREKGRGFGPMFLVGFFCCCEMAVWVQVQA
jgi:hypothetical protein